MSERDIVARELADKIRANVGDNDWSEQWVDGMHWAANLIDPWLGVHLPYGWQAMMRGTWQPAYGADGTVVGFMTPMGDET